jgi:DNA-directed RNA polymerase specialized sigma subunit
VSKVEKTDFKNYRALVLEVQQLKEQLAVLESSLYSPKGQRFTSTPRVPSGDRSTMDGAVDRHIKLARMYREELAEKEAQQLAIEQAIQSLSDAPERVVMRELYIAGKSWPAVINKMQKLGYSERTVYRLHGLALLKLKEV